MAVKQKRPRHNDLLFVAFCSENRNYALFHGMTVNALFELIKTIFCLFTPSTAHTNTASALAGPPVRSAATAVITTAPSIAQNNTTK
jgi:hypothetical protein